MAEAGADEVGGVVGIQDVPAENLAQALGLLSAEELGRAMAVCRGWRQLLLGAADLWQAACLRRWRQWESGQWEELMSQDRWWEVYAQRAALDARALRALGEMPWPERRVRSLDVILRDCGGAVEEALQRVAEREGDMCLGAQYWARTALAHLLAEEAAREMNLLKGREGAAVPLDKGALVLARVFAPQEDSSWVPAFLDELAAELRARLQAAGVDPLAQRRQALTMLNALLFGPLSPEDQRPEAGEGSEEGEEEAEAELGQARPGIPPRGYGMGLSGDRDNYYNPANSLLHQVLLRRRGIPISLAVIQCAVAVRCGMMLQTVNMPMHLLAKMEGVGEDDEVYIDCFDGGRLMDRRETLELMLTIGLPPTPQFLQPMQGHQVHVRMCANLVHVFRQMRDYNLLTQILRIMVAFNPNQEYLLMYAQVSLHHLECPEEALSVIQQLQGKPLSASAQRLAAEVAEAASAMQVALGNDQHEGHERSEGVCFHVGDIISHVRYDYRGVIHGWDPTCTASEEWIASMGVDSLPAGRHQPFYNVLVDCRDRQFQSTYVAQENIRLRMHEDPPPSGPGRDWACQHPDLGKHFQGFSATLSDGTPYPHYVPNEYLRSKYRHDRR